MYTTSSDSDSRLCQPSIQNLPAGSGVKSGSALSSGQVVVLSGQILRLLQEEFMIRFPAFPEIFGQLTPVPALQMETVSAAVPTDRKLQEISSKNGTPDETFQMKNNSTAETCKKIPRMEAALGTDGSHLYYEPTLLCAEFLQSPDRLKHAYLHVHVHCLCLHMFQDQSCQERLRRTSQNCTEIFDTSPPPAHKEQQHSQEYTDQREISGYEKRQDKNTEAENRKNLWDQACDLSAEFMTGLLLEEDQDLFAEQLSSAISGFSSLNYLDASFFLPLLEASPSLQELAVQCSRDTHRFWYEEAPDTDDSFPEQARASADDNSGRKSAADGHRSSFLRLQETLADKWVDQRRKLNTFLSNGAGHKNKEAGRDTEDAALQKRDAMDYRKFLHQFAVPREEPILDPDSFDYIPYCYGLTYYENMPFLEPLEYSEVNRLDELAIAIDTSGSCSGQIVRRFLEETWNILRQKENFFSRMRLHLIQCDSMIQDHQIFTSVEQWEEALPSLKIQGLGNTDFRPVFDYLNTLIQKKEIRRLRGLLYFTDGDGIYPRSRPPFDTAFVFLNRRLEKQKIPDWGIRLNLDLPDIYER